MEEAHEVTEEENFKRRVQLVRRILCDTVAVEKRFSPVPDASEIDEVYPNVYIGDECSARSIQLLRQLGITHIVNTAEGKGLGMVNTGTSYYNCHHIQYLGIELSDLSVSDASRYFKKTADYIEEALKNNGKVLVHCLMGISRSSTIVLAFLMLKRNFSVVEAVKQVRQRRNIHPNDGFINQLVTLDVVLERENKMRTVDSTS